MAADATTAMTIDFLRARLLSERSVSRAAKDRADQLARRVAELEEQLWTVTTQRLKAERAAAEVLDILESQGFDCPSYATDSGSDDGPGATESGKPRGEVEDTLSGSELEGTAAVPLAGGLSWKGRFASPDSERRQPHQKGRQLRQSHSHSHRRSYFYLLTADSSPKYQPGQSCRKIKRKELRLQSEGEDDKKNGTDSLGRDQDISDCTVCTDEQHDLDGDVSHDGQGSCGDGRVEIANDTYTMKYEKDGEMARVLEKQAELIGQYEAEENAQREWERKFSVGRDSTADDADLDDKLNQNERACEQGSKSAQNMDSQETRSSDKNIFSINSSSECLSNGSAPGLCTNAPEVSAIGRIKESDHDFEQGTEVVVSVDIEYRIRKDEFVNKCYTEIVETSGNNIGRSAPFPEIKYNISPNAGYSKGQGDGYSDSGSSYHADPCSSEYYINIAASVGNPLSDTPKSQVSEWSSSCFHNHTDNQIDRQLYQPPSDDVGGVLEALHRAKMSLKEKLSRPSLGCQDILALPAPEDHYTKDDLPANDRELSICMSRQLSQDILALPASGDYCTRINLPRDYAKVPVGPAGLFRLPTDSFPQNEVCSIDGYDSRFSLTAPSRHAIFSSNLANHVMSTPSHSHHDSGFSLNPYYDPPSSVQFSMPAAGWRSIPVSDFTARGSHVPEIVRSSGNSRRGMHCGDTGMLFQYGNAHNQ